MSTEPFERFAGSDRGAALLLFEFEDAPLELAHALFEVSDLILDRARGR